MLVTITSVVGQGLHFSQYYNAPSLINPANTALLPEDDYRAVANYRSQWQRIPVPFSTIAASTDFQLFRNVGETNWLGLGAAIFSDRAGDGNLALTNVQLTLAYHLVMGDYNMLSVGLGAGYVQRSVDFSRLTFDAQWDGFRFSRDMAQREPFAFQKTTYLDVVAGINYAFFPNENLYMKLGIGMLHINQPQESFYSVSNKLGMRPTANIDILTRLGDRWIVNPSVFGSYQKGASELVGGVQIAYAVDAETERPTVLYYGVYYRLLDAIIPMVGLEWSKIKIACTFDVNTSAISRAAGRVGAIEFSIMYRGDYGGSRGKYGRRNTYHCPRF